MVKRKSYGKMNYLENLENTRDDDSKIVRIEASQNTS